MDNEKSKDFQTHFNIKMDNIISCRIYRNYKQKQIVLIVQAKDRLHFEGKEFIDLQVIK